ncbi:MAG TPA: DUF1573 domain-containing protein [Planctomycetaceae bacterium]|jgi:hypothetical protein|nr:DUF1573 domain-containing protein [Planctomycetaceae bacterium]
MRPLGVVLAVVIGVSALAGTIWLGRYSPLADKPIRKKMAWEEGTAEAQMVLAKQAKEAAKEKEEKDKEAKKLAEKRPPIADKPPYPKARTGERVYEFGSMGVDEEKKHTFHIENRGQVPLEIAKGPTNCKCTISNISQSTIPPGGSAEVEMSWTPRDITPTFAKTATIWTNDPELSEIQFKIFGKVVRQFVVTPERTWHAGHVTDVQDGTVVGIVSSSIDPDFKILSVDTSDPHVKVVHRALNSKERMKEGTKAGYQFTVTVDKGIPPGHFRRPMKIHTSLEGNKTIDVEVTATRSGPILYLPPRGNSRAFWNSEKSLVNLGRFSHEVGSKVVLPALIYGSKEKFKILSVEKDADFLHVAAEPNPEIGGEKQQGVNFVFEIPPGTPAITRITPDGVHVKLKTNHPILKEMTFEVEFVSQ